MIVAMAEPEEKRRFRLGWSLFRRTHQAAAKRCHQVSHAARQALRPRRTPSPSSQSETPPTGTAPTNESVARLTDQQWERVRPLLPPHPPSAGSAGRDHRTTLEGVMWVLNNGASWRDLPKEEFGPWETVYGRYRRWLKEGRWKQVVETLLAGESR